jgi:hypothetical protein
VKKDNTTPAESKEKSSGLPIFVHSDLRELRLEKSEFRVLGHVASRGQCYETVENIASYCHMDDQTIRDCLQSLTEKGLISAQKRPGHTTLYEVNPRESWKVKPPKNGQGVELTPAEISHTTPPKAGQEYPSQKTVGVLLTPPKTRESTPPKIRESYPSQKTGDEGTPIEGAPMKGGKPLPDNRQPWQIRKDAKAELEAIEVKIKQIKSDPANCEYGLANETAMVIAFLRETKPEGWREQITARESNPNNQVFKKYKPDADAHIKALQANRAAMTRKLNASMGLSS